MSDEKKVRGRRRVVRLVSQYQQLFDPPLPPEGGARVLDTTQESSPGVKLFVLVVLIFF